MFFFVFVFFNRLKNKLLKMRAFILVCLMIVAAATAIQGKKNIFFTARFQHYWRAYYGSSEKLKYVLFLMRSI